MAGETKHKVLASLLGVGIALGIGEIASRIYTNTGSFLLSHNPVIQRQAEGTEFFVPDSKYGHRLRGGDFVGKTRLETLDEVVREVKRADSWVLHLGDSSTSGWNSDTVTENFERKKQGKEFKSPLFTYPTYSDVLNEEGIVSVNAGVPGYSSDTGNRKIGDLLASFKERGITPNYVTIYFGNNDSVWNLNVLDKDLFVEQLESHLIAIMKEKIGMLSSYNSTRTRVPIQDYKENLRNIISTIRSYDSRPLLIEPITPKWWKPGLRAKGQETELTELLNGDYAASKNLRLATAQYEKGIEAYNRGDISTAKTLFMKARENDFIVPRIKERYRAALRGVAQETNTPLITIRSQIPLDDRNHFIDYCHPIEPANKIIAQEIIKEIKTK